MCARACAHMHVCVHEFRYPWRPEISDFLELTGVCETPSLSAGTVLGPLKGQFMLLATEASL